MIQKDKKAFYFTLDAMFALIVLISVISVISYTGISTIESQYKTSYLQEDAIAVLSTVKTSEINSIPIQNILQNVTYNESLTSTDTLLETISKLWATNYTDDSKSITAEFFGDTIEPSDNFGLFFRNQTNQLEPIFVRGADSIDDAIDIVSTRYYISGVEKGSAIFGYSARAFLQKKELTKIIYFGGYIGDGNITVVVDLPNITAIRNVSLEFAPDIETDLYINNHFAQTISAPTNELTPVEVYLSNTTFEFIENGTNFFEFKSTEGQLAISGGYIEVVYRTNNPEYDSTKRQYLHGVKGVINEYDSIYAPDTITSMNARLHYNITTAVTGQNITFFLKIGNYTIYSNTSNTSVSDYVTEISNENINETLGGDYGQISNQTIPVRLGFEEFGEGLNKGNADVVLITDLSGSMNFALVNESNGVIRNCTDSQLYENTTQRVSLAKCLDKEFINILLSISGNRVALSAFYGDASPPNKGRVYSEDLTNNATYLEGKINLYAPQGGTCICCAINNAYNILNTQSNSSRKKYVIVMSDGIPTHTCAAANKCEGTRDGTPSKEGLWLGNAGCYGYTEDCNTTNCECGSQNANWSSCRVHNDLSAKVYSIGFGPVAGCNMANKTLKNVASCGEGQYYSSDNASQLKQIYQNISEEILGLSFIEQKSNISGNFLSVLYNDSYIEYDYNFDPCRKGVCGGMNLEEARKFGNVITYESPSFSNSRTSFNFTNGAVLDATVTSYSGAKWTKYVSINNTQKTGGSFEKIYDLSTFGSIFSILGDPFRVNIPIEKISPDGEVNTVELKIANSSKSSDELNASASDKIIYTLLVLSNYSYSNITQEAKGCNWIVEYEDGTTGEFPVPSNYTEGNYCYFNSSDGTDCLYESTEEIIARDAIAQAAYMVLMNYLDKNPQNCRLDIKVTDYYITTMLMPSVPFLKYTTAEILSWR